MSNDLNRRVTAAVKHFWKTRANQQKNQGSKSGQRDSGARGAVTGGKQLDGFIELFSELLDEAGLPGHAIYRQKKDVALPGYFRPTKEWDLIVVADGCLVASIECKSQVGSFGNNFNNRVEEALGTAVDHWTAYKKGAFKPSAQPWIGWFMLLEDAAGSDAPVRVKEPHFPVFSEFKDVSYAQRYELFCLRLVRERLYNAACLILTPQKGGTRGIYREPSEEVSFLNFATSLSAHAASFVRLRNPR